MKISKIFVSALILTIFCANPTKAQSLSDILGGLTGGNGNSGLGTTIGNMIEGVFSSSNITVADMAGDWQATGPAVTFQSENLLKKAGGIAAASAIETKIAPYYQQFGLNNATLVIDQEGNFTLTCKAIKLNGTITQEAGAQPGVFSFNFTVMGKKLAGVTTYVQKTSSSMDVMFDATKLKNLLSAIGQFTGIQTVQAVTSILNSYDGLCLGFNFKGTSTNSTGIGSGNGLNLGNILGGFGIGGGTNNNGGTTNTQTETEVQTETESTPQSTGNSSNSDKISSGLDLLRGILKK